MNTKVRDFDLQAQRLGFTTGILQGHYVSEKVYAFVQKVDAVRETLARWATVKRHRKELARLNDHMLKDIGLTRFDVQQELNKPFWR